MSNCMVRILRKGSLIALVGLATSVAGALAVQAHDEPTAPQAATTLNASVQSLASPSLVGPGGSMTRGAPGSAVASQGLDGVTEVAAVMNPSLPPIAVSQLSQGSGFLQGWSANTKSTAVLTIPANALAVIQVTQENATGGVPALTDPNRSWQQVILPNLPLEGRMRYQSVWVSQLAYQTQGAVTITSPASAVPANPNSMSWKVFKAVNTRIGNNGLDAIAQADGRAFETAFVLAGDVALIPSSDPTSVVLTCWAVINQVTQSGAFTPGTGFALVGGIINSPALWTQAEASQGFQQPSMSWIRASHYVAVALELRQ